MRIAVLTSLYPSPPRPREGVFAERRWVGMAHRGHEVRVIRPVPYAPPFARGERAEFRRMPRAEVRDGVPIARPRYLHLPGRALGNAQRFARAALRPLDSGPLPQVVVADYAWPAAAALDVLADRGLPFVLHGRGSDVLQVRDVAALRPALEHAARWADARCAVSRDLCAALDELAGSPGAVLTPNGVDGALFRPGERGGARAALGRAGSEPWVLVVGHLIERKDPLLALRSFVEGAPEQARLFYVGRGPLEGELRAEVERRGVADRVELLGERPPEELATWYAASDALLLTSSREGRPNVVLEALAASLPVVATAAGGTAELLEGVELPGGGSPVCASREPGAIATMLRRTLAEPPPPETLRAAVESLTWEACLAQLEGLLESIAAEADAR